MVTDVPGPAAPDLLRKDQRERRARIVRAGLRSLSGSDYDKVKVSDLARDSEVALGTLYRYFASKEHLFAAVFAEWQDGLKRKLDRIPRRTAPRATAACGPAPAPRDPRLPDAAAVLPADDRPADHRRPPRRRDLPPLDGLFADIMRSAVEGADETVVSTLRAVADQGLRGWIMGRQPIQAVYQAVDDTLRLIRSAAPGVDFFFRVFGFFSSVTTGPLVALKKNNGLLYPRRRTMRGWFLSFPGGGGGKGDSKGRSRHPGGRA